MKKLFLQFLKDIPLMALCIFLAFFIWIFATMTSDPTEEGRFSQTITIETVGLAENCMITSGLPSSVSVNLDKNKRTRTKRKMWRMQVQKYMWRM